MDKKYVYAGVAIVVVLLIAYAVWPKPAATPTPQPSPTPQAQEQPATNTTDSATSSTPTTGTKKLSYGEAIKAYKFRFQLTMCHGNPGYISAPKSSPIMLDNRDNKAHTINAVNQTIRIAPLDYALLYPATVGDFTLLCDGGGAGTLHIEK